MKLFHGDCLTVLKTLKEETVDCCVTSPPYWWLRDYGVVGQFGLEKTPEEYVAKMVDVFREVRRVLKKEGTLWLNLGDSYCGTGSKGEWTDPKYKEGRNGQVVAINNKIQGLKSKDLVGIPWRVAFALQADSWHFRQDIIWHKPNPMPESVTDRCTKAHEYIFLLAKNKKYYFNNEAIKENSVTYENRHFGIVREREYGCDSKQNKIRVSLGKKSFSKGQAAARGIEPSGNGKNEFYEVPLRRNKRSVWTVTTKPFKDAHFAVFPEALIEPCIKAGCPKGGVVLDPFMGSGTTGVVAQKQRKDFIGIELNAEYIKMAKKRFSDNKMLWNG